MADPPPGTVIRITRQPGRWRRSLDRIGEIAHRYVVPGSVPSDPMSLHRSVVAAALRGDAPDRRLLDDSSADPTPVTAGPTTSVAPTTTAGIETTTTTTTQAATSTTSASPPVTKPLTTAPPSELLTDGHRGVRRRACGSPGRPDPYRTRTTRVWAVTWMMARQISGGPSYEVYATEWPEVGASRPDVGGGGLRTSPRCPRQW